MLTLKKSGKKFHKKSNKKVFAKKSLSKSEDKEEVYVSSEDDEDDDETIAIEEDDEVIDNNKANTTENVGLCGIEKKERERFEKTRSVRLTNARLTSVSGDTTRRNSIEVIDKMAYIAIQAAAVARGTNNGLYDHEKNDNNVSALFEDGEHDKFQNLSTSSNVPFDNNFSDMSDSNNQKNERDTNASPDDYVMVVNDYEEVSQSGESTNVKLKNKEESVNCAAKLNDEPDKELPAILSKVLPAIRSTDKQ